MSEPLRIPVVCAVIRQGPKYLACQRSEIMRQPLQWEFPGGKIEAGESLIAALHREMSEELSAKVSVHGILRPSRDFQNQKVIELHAVLCTLADAHFELAEHKAFQWICAEDFASLDWCEADREILEMLQMPALEATGWWGGE